jgi:uncharacterized protein (DUF2147 family)
MYDFVYNGGNKWNTGKVYDPTNGKEYRDNMTLVSPNKLNFCGFIGISLLGRTEILIRQN